MKKQIEDIVIPDLIGDPVPMDSSTPVKQTVSLRSAFRGNDKKEMGQALVTLLFFVGIGMTIITAAIAMLIINSLGGVRYQQGTVAYQLAQTGADNAVLRLLRDPSYTGETMTLSDGTVVTQVSGNGYPFTILSQGTVGNFSRQIQMTASYSAASVLEVTAQQEVL